MSNPTIRLIHWNAAEGAERADAIRAAGYDVLFEMIDPPELRRMRDNPPDAFVVDLTRTPSKGRDVGFMVRYHKSTRHVPLVFVEGEPEKVARLRELIPDAIYTTWKTIGKAIEEGLSQPPNERAGHVSAFVAFAGTPLVKKLGIRENYSVGLVNAPEEIVGELPEGTVMRNGVDGAPDLIFWFIRSREEMRSDIDWIAENIGRGGVWIAWPKKSAGYTTDLSQTVIRAIGFEAGLVDYKICSIDATWSGMRFSRRKEK
jgi:hypothetical protein